MSSSSSLDAVLNCGLIPDDTSACESNTLRLASCVTNNSAISIDSVVYLYPGVQLRNVHNVVLNITGELRFLRPPYPLPRDTIDPFSNHVVSCLSFSDSSNLTLTGSRGLLHGGGPSWWGLPFVGFLLLLERRPKLLQITTSTNIEISHLNFQDSPMYTIYLNGVTHVQIHDISIANRRRDTVNHGLVDLSAFNTDGIDVAGHNIWIANVDIVTQDDCIAIKDNYLGDGSSSDIVVENVNATGLGFVIGSIGGTVVENVVFRDSLLYHTFKGIYAKFRDYDLVGTTNSFLRNITFENIVMVQPQQWAVWLGPAQQTTGSSYNPCIAGPCSICWPTVPGAQCFAPTHVSILDSVFLANVTIINPAKSLGVILGSNASPIRNVIFENVYTEFVDSYNVNVRETFPGSNLPVYDPMVQQGLVWLLCLLVVATSLIVLSVRHCRRHGPRPEFIPIPTAEEARASWAGNSINLEEEEEEESSYADVVSAEDDMPIDATNDRVEVDIVVNTSSQLGTSAYLLSRFGMLACGFLLVVLVAWIYRVRSELTAVDQYFVCTGVENGVAMGRTWPVPNCFRDETVAA